MADDSFLLSFHEILLDGGDLRTNLKNCFSQAKRFLEASSVPELMDSVFAEHPACRSVLAAVNELDHVGFLIPQGDLIQDVGSAARDAGFDQGHASFPSTVLARELGVPATVFKASCATGERIEAFMPSTDEGTVRQWIQNGIGTHVAVSLSSPPLFLKMLDVLRSEGFRTPAFMNNKPMTNVVEQVAVVYFDVEVRARPLRIEFILRGAL